MMGTSENLVAAASVNPRTQVLHSRGPFCSHQKTREMCAFFFYISPKYFKQSRGHQRSLNPNSPTHRPGIGGTEKLRDLCQMTPLADDGTGLKRVGMFCPLAVFIGSLYRWDVLTSRDVLCISHLAAVKMTI